MQFSLTLGILPLTLLFFHEASIISLVANAVAVPWVGFLVIPLCMLGTISLFINASLGHLFLFLAAKAISLIWHVLEYLAALPIASIMQPIYNIWILILSMSGMLILLAPYRSYWRLLGLAALAPLFFYIPERPNTNEVWFTLLDVGQGLASVVRTQHHLLIYDTGPKFFDAADAGATTVLPFLQNFGAKKIDMLVVSHADADHSGGAKSILTHLPVEKLITSAPDFFTPYPAQNCIAGEHWEWDGIKFTFLHPGNKSGFDGNDASCVLQIAAHDNKILLTGDIEQTAEEFILKNPKNPLNTTILVVPHHGSNSSSSMPFIKATHPEYALFATGYLNRFHFPSFKVIRRYQENNAHTLNTSETGAITFKFSAQVPLSQPELYRQVNKHYWNNY